MWPEGPRRTAFCPQAHLPFRTPVLGIRPELSRDLGRHPGSRCPWLQGNCLFSPPWRLQFTTGDTKLAGVSLLTALRVNDHHNYCPRQRPITPLGPFFKADECSGDSTGHASLPWPQKPRREASGQGGPRIVSHGPPWVLGSGIPREQAPPSPVGSGAPRGRKVAPLHGPPHTASQLSFAGGR